MAGRRSRNEECISLRFVEHLFQIVMEINTPRQFLGFIRIQVMCINQLDSRRIGNGLHLVVGNLTDSDQRYLHKFMLLSMSFNNNAESVL